MCGRFVFFPDDDQERVMKLIKNSLPGITGLNKYDDIRRDIYPSQVFPVITQTGTHPAVIDMQWGYPPASKKSKSLLINARAETAEKKYTFRNDFAHRRCIIPATGFYEWSKEKQKYLFGNESGILFIGGLYTKVPESELTSKDKLDDKFVILTKLPDLTVSPVHNRMPVLVPQSLAHAWLTNRADANRIINDYSVKLINENSTAQTTMF